MATAQTMIGTSLCRRCAARVELTDRFCRHCGRSTAHEDEDVVAPFPTAPAWTEPGPVQVRWSDRRWFVLVMLFFVLGPLALPMLWSSRSFTAVSKTVLTALGLGTTVLVLFAGMLPLEHLLAPLRHTIPNSSALFGP
jgi:hypothetical protein